MKANTEFGSAGLLNCWEFTGCGREPGGDRADDLGVCPAAADRRFDGINGGKNGGRTCWVVAGTAGRVDPEGIFASAETPCSRCRFYHLVQSTTPGVPDQELLERLTMRMTALPIVAKPIRRPVILHRSPEYKRDAQPAKTPAVTREVAHSLVEDILEK